MDKNVRILLTARNAVLILVFLASLSISQPVQADVAPPDQPPGGNPQPGVEQTQVQMVSEQVVLDVYSMEKGSSDVGDLGHAAVSAHFDMKNQGSSDEQMQARFPLMDPSGMGDGFGNFPEIQDLKVKIDQKTVDTTKITTPNPNNAKDPGVTWAAFDITFPAGEDVLIDVTYTMAATGYQPLASFTYILETGAGWKDAIGIADIIVRLPYEANDQNVLDESGWSDTTKNRQYAGNEIRWHFENLEPEKGQNFQVTLVAPYAWQNVLDARKTVETNPNNGDAWGALARAYKFVNIEKYMRTDPGGVELYQLSVEAYEKAISLVPKTARWHAGYAELLWYHYFSTGLYTQPNEQEAELIKAVQELKTALSLDHANDQAKNILFFICQSIPEAVKCQDSKYDYPILTATIYFTPFPSATPRPSATPPPTKTEASTMRAPTKTQALSETQRSTPKPSMTVQAAEQTTVEPSKETAATPTPGKNSSLPCPSAILVPALIAVLPAVLLKKQHRRNSHSKKVDD